jgi:hypothetical protein
MAAKRSCGACTSRRTRSVATSSITGVPRATHSPTRQAPRDHAGERRRHDVTPQQLGLLALGGLGGSQRGGRELGLRFAPRELGLRQVLFRDQPTRLHGQPLASSAARAPRPSRPGRAVERERCHRRESSSSRGARLDAIARIDADPCHEAVDPGGQPCAALGGQRPREAELVGDLRRPRRHDDHRNRVLRHRTGRQAAVLCEHALECIEAGSCRGKLGAECHDDIPELLVAGILQKARPRWTRHLRRRDLRAHAAPFHAPTTCQLPVRP